MCYSPNICFFVKLVARLGSYLCSWHLERYDSLHMARDKEENSKQNQLSAHGGYISIYLLLVMVDIFVV